MHNILVDAERGKYPHSGVGFFASCLVRGLAQVEAELPRSSQLIYYTPRGYEVEGRCRRHYGWHRLVNPTVWDASLVHITHQLQTYFPRLKRGSRCVLTLHDLNFLYEELTPARRQRRLAIVRRNVERADVVVCISHFVKACFWEHRDLFCLKPDARIDVIHNGLCFCKYEAHCPEGLYLPEDAEYMLSIGVLHHKKQQHTLVEMLSMLPKHIHLVLVYSGTSHYEAVIRRSVAQHGLQERVHFLQNVSHGAKQYLLEHCLAYVHPSLAEGFGIPPIEAMHAGRPVFLSTATSLPEIGGQEAYYFRSMDPQMMAEDLLHGLQDYQTCPNKAERLKEWADRYDYRSMARAYRQLYEEVLVDL